MITYRIISRQPSDRPGNADADAKRAEGIARGSLAALRGADDATPSEGDTHVCYQHADRLGQPQPTPYGSGRSFLAGLGGEPACPRCAAGAVRDLLAEFTDADTPPDQEAQRIAQVMRRAHAIAADRAALIYRLGMATHEDRERLRAETDAA